MQNSGQGTKNFSTQELGSVIKSRKNLIYLLELSGQINRLLFTSQSNVYTNLHENSHIGKQKVHEDESNCSHSRHSSDLRNQHKCDLGRHQN